MINCWFFKKFKAHQKGTSLIELLLYFALLSIVLALAADLMIRSGEFSLESAAKNDLQEEARFAMNRIAYDVHRADSVIFPAAPGQLATSLWLDINGVVKVYYVLDSKIQLYSNDTGTWTQVTSDSVTTPTSFTFDNFSNAGGKPTIKITFTLKSTTSQKGGSRSKTFESVVGLR